MAVWAVQDAKARFSEMLDRCITEGSQIVTRRGEQAAVLVPIAEWRRLSAAARPTIHDVLLSDLGRGDLDVPERGKMRHRQVIEF
jgi:prevent-host-death family protein